MAIITLLGYMGSGKSTYGKLLAREMKYRFIDLDDYIVEKTNMSISEIFKNKGEKWFRDFETESLNDILKNNKLILSLGGGTPIYNDNMYIINSKSESIYLNASVITLYNYLKNERINRPIIKELSDEELKKFISIHLIKRTPFYNLAKYKVITDYKNINDIVSELTAIVSVN